MTFLAHVLMPFVILSVNNCVFTLLIRNSISFLLELTRNQVWCYLIIEKGIFFQNLSKITICDNILAKSLYL
jgi:hypothetical protein